MWEAVLGIVSTVTDAFRDQKWSQSLMSEKTLCFSGSFIGNIISLSAWNIGADYNAVGQRSWGDLGRNVVSLSNFTRSTYRKGWRVGKKNHMGNKNWKFPKCSAKHYSYQEDRKGMAISQGCQKWCTLSVMIL